MLDFLVEREMWFEPFSLVYEFAPSLGAMIDASTLWLVACNPAQDLFHSDQFLDGPLIVGMIEFLTWMDSLLSHETF